MTQRPLCVHVDAIKGEGYTFDEVLSEAWLKTLFDHHPAFTPVGDGRFHGTLTRAQDTVRARGAFTLRLEQNCARCLLPVQFEVAEVVDVTLFPAGALPAADAEGEVTLDDLGVSEYQPPEVDLGEVFREEVLLDAPPHPICGEYGIPKCADYDQVLARIEASRQAAKGFAFRGLSSLNLDKKG